jgi:hypothetical protein
MVSIVWALIAISSGFLAYLIPAAAGQALPIDLRYRVGTFYYKLSARAFGQFAFVRRILGGYELHPIQVDDEHKTAQVTLASGMISDDQILPFKDPADAVSRLYSKPVTLLVEEVPAALDAELSELGYWTQEHDFERGLVQEHDGDTKIDPYVRMSDGLRLVDPVDSLSLVTKNVAPENIQTAKELTRRRFDEYGSKVDAVQMLSLFTGFAVGVGGVAVVQYMKSNVIESGGGTGGSSPIDGGTLPGGFIDATSHALAHADISLVVGLL